MESCYPDQYGHLASVKFLAESDQRIKHLFAFAYFENILLVQHFNKNQLNQPDSYRKYLQVTPKSIRELQIV